MKKKFSCDAEGEEFCIVPSNDSTNTYEVNTSKDNPSVADCSEKNGVSSAFSTVVSQLDFHDPNLFDTESLEGFLHSSSKDRRGQIDLRFYALKIVKNVKNDAKNSLRQIGFIGKFTSKDLYSFSLTGKISKLSELLSGSGKLRYLWYGYTYIFLDKVTGINQMGLSTLPLPLRFNWYMHNSVLRSESRYFKTDGRKTIHGYIFDYLENTYGIDSFKDKQGRLDFDIIQDIIEERFMFIPLAVFWTRDSLRLSESELIAFGKFGSSDAKYDSFTKKFLYSYTSEKIEQIASKYGISQKYMGKSLNHCSRAGYGGEKNDLILLTVFYIAMGYSHKSIHDVLIRNHGYNRSLAKFKKVFQLIFGSIESARERFTREVIDLLTQEGYTKTDINKLFPLMRAFNRDLFFELTEEGYPLNYIAVKLGFSTDQSRRYAKNIIINEFPNLQIYKYSGGEKKAPTFEDLQYYLLGQKILKFLYDDLSRKEIINKFQRMELVTFDKICKRVLWNGDVNDYSFFKLRDKIIRKIISEIIYKKNPQTIEELYEDPKLKIPLGTLKAKLGEFFANNSYMELVYSQGHKRLKRIEYTKIALIGPILEHSFKLGLSDELILNKIGNKYSKDDLNRICKFIWGRDTTGARLLF